MSGTREGGRAAQHAGSGLERWVDEQHETAMCLGLLVHAEHTQARAKVVGGKLIYERPGVADYVLCLAGGRYAAVEAKSTSSGRLARSRVESLQARHLGEVARGGGISLLLVEYSVMYLGSERVPPLRCAIPWADVPWTVGRSAEGLSYQDVWEWRVDGCYLSRYAEPMCEEDGSLLRFGQKRVISRG